MTIYNSSYQKNSFSFHPWFNGKIFHEDKSVFKIFVSSGILIVKKNDIKFDYNITLKKLVGKTLFNDPKALTNSVSNIPNIFNYKQ